MPWKIGSFGYNNSMKILLGIFLIIVFSGTPACPAEEREENSIPFLERAQEIFGTQANVVANQLDSFFATERADDEFGRSRIRIRSQFFLREQDRSEFNNQYRINLKLPNLEKKFRFEMDRDKKKKKETSNLKKENQQKKNELNQAWIFNSDIGVSAAVPPLLITRARLRKNVETGILIHRFSEQLIYITDETGLSEETSLDSDLIFDEKFVFRFVNFKRWRIHNKEFNTNHGPTLIQQLSDNEALNYGLTAQSVIQNGIWYFNNYRLAINYRRNVYRQWIYFDIIPGIDFPKEFSFRRTPFVNFQLEILFGT
jgi:hypothetical protein